MVNDDIIKLNTITMADISSNNDTFRELSEAFSTIATKTYTYKVISFKCIIL